jgi:STAS-like domain of unknown function (DUF4325)
MSAYQIKITDTDLASRQAAADLRAEIEIHAHNGERTLIDLEAVLSISESYADELFGVLAVRYGLEWLFDKVKLRHANPHTSRSIANAIHQRLQSLSPDIPNVALLAAREAIKHRQFKNS